MITGGLESQGMNIAYHRSGDGDPVVFLHGAMADHSIWADQIEVFQRRNSVIVWDGPGAGESDDPPEGFTLEECAISLSHLLEHLSMPAAHVVGHSFGGGLAIEFQLMFPKRVRSLVLVGAYAGWAGSLSPEEVEERLAGVYRAMATEPETLIETFMATLLESDVSDEVRTRVRRSLAGFHPVGTKIFAEAFAVADLSASLPDVSAPTTVVHGERDQRAKAPVAARLAESIPNAVLEVIPGVGHDSFLEDPEGFNMILARHLARHG
jgi:pimeloyl-ACP methyl ester carboxylesterase